MANRIPAPEALSHDDLDSVTGGIKIAQPLADYSTSAEPQQSSDPGAWLDGYCIVTETSLMGTCSGPPLATATRQDHPDDKPKS